MRMLIVEDEPVTALFVEMLMAEMGCRVVANVRDMAQAMRLAQTAEVDIALLDLDLDLDGECAMPVAAVLMNLVAVADLVERFPDLDILFIESGGVNLTVTFSPEFVDSFIFVIDVGQGEEIPRKGGTGISRSPLLLINKINIAKYFDTDVGVMESDARRLRGGRPIILGDMKDGIGVDEITAWIKSEILMGEE